MLFCVTVVSSGNVGLILCCIVNIMVSVVLFPLVLCFIVVVTLIILLFLSVLCFFC